MICHLKANEVRSRAFATLRRLRQQPAPARFTHTPVDAWTIKTALEPDTCRYNSIIEDHLRIGLVSAARKVYDEMPRRNTVSTNLIISGHLKSGDVAAALQLFDAMEDRTVVTWTNFMGWYSRNNQFVEAFKFFRQFAEISLLRRF